MSQNEEQIISRMGELIKFEKIEEVSTEDLIAWVNNVLNIFRTFMHPDNKQIRLLEDKLNEFLNGELYYSDRQKKLFSICRAILKSVISDYKNGFLKDLRAEIRSEVDVDFLSQANRLLDDKLKDAAAMIIGAVLEDTLRQLCEKHGIPEGPKIETMNAPLKQDGVYSLAVQKQITAWADIRNNADHARFDQYDSQQIKLMHQGVTDFIAKYLS
jgi:hypothetical protein